MDTSTETTESSIPKHLRIRVIHADDEIVVIDKPNNLRSVPGFAEKRGKESDNVMLPPQRTGHEAWVMAIQSFQNDSKLKADPSATSRCMLQMATSAASVHIIPRKYQQFRRYVQRNKKRLFGVDGKVDVDIDTICRDTFVRIKERQVPLLNLPKRTSDEESAFGQLIQLGYSSGGQGSSECNPDRMLHVVHRLDCETSGLMVFARCASAASHLSKQWRERNTVSKTYLAHVEKWPPFDNDKQASGTISVSLAPSDEGIRWKAVTEHPSDEHQCKQCTTIWKVIKGPAENIATYLELTPITGRTHQLRVHCAHVGSGIVGDSLYGNSNADNCLPAFDETSMLRLHASRLSFCHPKTESIMSFSSSSPSWFE